MARGIKIDEILANEEEKKPVSTTHPLHAVFPRDTKIGSAIAWWAAAYFAYGKIKNAWNWFKEKTDDREKFTVGISSWEEPEFYNVVFKWISENMDPDQKIDNFLLVTGYHKRRWVVSKASAGQGIVKCTIAGIPVKVAFSEKEGKEEGSSVSTRRRDLIIKCKNQENVDTVTEFLEDIWHKWNSNETDELEDALGLRTPRYPYYVWNGQHWFTRRFTKRDRDSVILKQGQSEDLFNDVERFLSLKNEYSRVNIPWHRGYLLYGPAGTGKTSLAMAVASTFDIPVHSLSLSTIESNKDLLRAIAAIDTEEAVLILEDIDVAGTTHSREANKEVKGKQKLALDVLLNVLDGAGTPSGLITIMTTNYIDRLDDALIRPGRVDYRLLVDDLNDEQLHRMMQWYTGLSEFKLPKIESSITPADITGVVKSYIGHPDLCIAQVKSLIESKNES